MSVIRNINKWGWFGLVFIIIGLIANGTSGNMPAFGWGIAALGWFVVAELMRQQYDQQREFVQELLRENALLRLDRKLRP